MIVHLYMVIWPPTYLRPRVISSICFGIHQSTNVGVNGFSRFTLNCYALVSQILKIYNIVDISNCQNKASFFLPISETDTRFNTPPNLFRWTLLFWCYPYLGLVIKTWFQLCHEVLQGSELFTPSHNIS